MLWGRNQGDRQAIPPSLQPNQLKWTDQVPDQCPGLNERDRADLSADDTVILGCLSGTQAAL